MFLLFAALLAFGTARRHSRRHHRCLPRNFWFDGKYKLFKTIWDHVFQGQVNYEQLSGQLSQEYEQFVRDYGLTKWGNTKTLMDKSRIHPAIRQICPADIWKDSVRTVPDWKRYGVVPDAFVLPDVIGRFPEKPKTAYASNYGKHHRRIERVLMVLHKIDPNSEYAYAQHYFEIVTTLYIAGVRCNKITPDMAEAAAFHMMRRLIDRRLLLIGDAARSFWLSGVLINDLGLARYQQQDPALDNYVLAQIEHARLGFGCRPLDLEHFAKVLVFDNDAPIFCQIHRAFMIKGRLESRRGKEWYKQFHDYKLVRPSEGGLYTPEENRAAYKKAVTYFRKNIQRIRNHH